jgi:hypothetical protein
LYDYLASRTTEGLKQLLIGPEEAYQGKLISDGLERYDAGSAQASANLFSLVMTCRINGVEPFAYPNYLFEHLPAASTVEQVEALLPWNLKAILDEQKKSSIDSCTPPNAASRLAKIHEEKPARS